MDQFTDGALDRRTVAEIQRKVTKQSRRNAVSRLFHARNDKDMIAAWKLDLGRILQVFNVRSVIVCAWWPLIVFFQTELIMNIHITISDIRHDVLNIRGEISGQVFSASGNPTQPVDNRRIFIIAHTVKNIPTEIQ